MEARKGLRKGDVIFRFNNAVMPTTHDKWEQQVMKIRDDCGFVQQSHLHVCIPTYVYSYGKKIDMI